MQISILAILFAISVNCTEVFDFFMNSLLFFILSIVGASVFHLVGGEIGSIEFWPVMFAVFCYQLSPYILK